MAFHICKYATQHTSYFNLDPLNAMLDFSTTVKKQDYMDEVEENEGWGQ